MYIYIYTSIDIYLYTYTVASVWCIQNLSCGRRGVREGANGGS